MFSIFYQIVPHIRQDKIAAKTSAKKGQKMQNNYKSAQACSCITTNGAINGFLSYRERYL
jgi:hypothetical protein